MNTDIDILRTQLPARRRLPYSEMMPVESYYRPRPIGRATGGLLFLTMMFTGFVFGAPAWLLAGIVCFYVVALGATREGAEAIAKNQQAIDLLNNGNVHDAAREFDRLARTETKQAAHAVYVFNRAVAYMLEGRLQKAMSLLNAVDHSRAFDRGPNRAYGPYLYAEMATCLALMGLIPEAKAEREKAFRALNPEELHRLVLVDAIVALRQGDPRSALQIMDQYWDQAYENLRPPSFRGLMLMRAFALKQLGQTSSAYEGLLRATRSSRPGEFDYLGVDWPLMKRFLMQERRWNGGPHG